MHRRVALSLLGTILVAMLAVAGAQSRSHGRHGQHRLVGRQERPDGGLTGPALDGLRAYFKMVNDAGGVKGNKINLIEQDDGYNVAKEVGIVKSFINDDKVVLVTGIGNSSGFSSILPLLNASKTPPSSTRAR